MSIPSNTSATGQQILQDAGFYPPSVYDLLSRFSALFTTNDPDSDGYVPYTDVQPGSSTQVIPFVVGFLPPSAPVASPTPRTGNTAVQSLLSNSALGNVNNRAQLAASSGGAVPSTTPPGENGGPPTYQKYSEAQISGIIYQTLLAQNGTPPSNETVWMLTAQSWRETSGNWPDNNPGFVNNTSAARSGNPTSDSFVVHGYGQALTFASFGSPQAGAQAFANTALSSGAARSTAASGDVTGFVSALGSAGYYAPYTDNTTGIHYDQAAAQQQYEAGFAPLYAGAKSNAPDPSSIDVSNIIGGPGVAQPVTGDVPQPNAWNSGGGGASAQTAAYQLDVQSATVLNPANTATQSLASQQTAIINAITQQVNQMVNTPPLRLLVNPRSFKNSLEKITSDGSWGRNGPIIEHWGEQMDKIEASGKIAAFYALDSNPPGLLTDNDPGLTRMVRNSSTAYQNLLSLYLIYRNNAGIWTQDFINPASTKTNLSIVGSIFIFYDNILYVGSFDNFTISESDEAPYSLEYSFSFTVRAWFEMDQQQDPLLAWGPVGTAPTSSSLDPAVQQLSNGVQAAVGAVVNNSQAASDKIFNVTGSRPAS
jgi:hypothetical protein